MSARPHPWVSGLGRIYAPSGVIVEVSAASSERDDGLVVLDGWERVVEVVEKGAPALVLRRFPEAVDVVFQSVPPDEKYVAVVGFDAPLKLEADEAGHGCDQGLGLREGSLEFGGLAGLHVEHCEFQGHRGSAGFAPWGGVGGEELMDPLVGDAQDGGGVAHADPSSASASSPRPGRARPPPSKAADIKAMGS